MATTNRILIKSKSSAAGAPSTSDVQIGELAVNTVTGLTYLGTNSSNTGLSAGGVATEVSTVGMPIDTTDTLGTSDVKLATQGAIKTYVDAQVAGGDTTLANTKIWIGDSNGDKAEFALSGDVTMTAGGAVTIANDAVESGMLNDNCISGFTNIGAAPANGDELLISDGGTLKAMTVANLAANSSFASGVPTTITVADESSDSTCFPLFATAATGDLAPKSGSNLTFASNTGILTATGFAGDITGDVTGDVTGNADTSTKIASITNSNIVQLTSSQTLTNKTLTAPTLTTPALGTPSALVLTNATALPAAQVAQGTMASGMVLVAPALGTPASGTLTNCTFPTANINTDVDVSNANLLTKLAALESSSGAANENITIGTDSGDTIVITGNLQVSGTTTTVNSTTVNLNDHNIVLDSGNSTSAVVDGAGITLEGGSGDDATFTYSTTGPQFEMKLGSSYEDLQVAKLTAASLDISGDVDVDGTLETDALTIGGTTLAETIADTAGAMFTGNTETGITATYQDGDNTIDLVVGTLNQDTTGTATNATNAAHVLLTDNESTDENNAIVFGEGASYTGNVGLESDGDFHYNPSSGTVTATIFKGNVDAVDGDFDGTLEADAITVGGTALNTVIAGVTVSNATTAAVATTVTITDNESTNEDNAIIFTAGGDTDGGNLGLESDGTCTYNPSTGKITATGFIGALTGNVTGDVTGNADTSTKIASITNSNIVQLTATQTLTNKTIAGGTFT